LKRLHNKRKNSPLPIIISDGPLDEIRTAMVLMLSPRKHLIRFPPTACMRGERTSFYRRERKRNGLPWKRSEQMHKANAISNTSVGKDLGESLTLL
jgi:hypothetical protein